eukprot:752603-Hanusia_phi.AAC.3
MLHRNMSECRCWNILTLRELGLIVSSLEAEAPHSTFRRPSLHPKSSLPLSGEIHPASSARVPAQN